MLFRQFEDVERKKFSEDISASLRDDERREEYFLLRKFLSPCCGSLQAKNFMQMQVFVFKVIVVATHIVSKSFNMC